MIFSEKKYFILLIFIVAFFIFLNNFLFSEEKVQSSSQILVGDTPVFVEFARTEKERAQGLSGREKLEENEGLFFIFEKNGTYLFWMKDMKFPIDILWISEDFVVVDITKNAEPNSYPKTFLPKQPVRYVLEIGSGLSNSLGINIGDKISGISLAVEF